jgi:hypothetical protein
MVELAYYAAPGQLTQAARFEPLLRHLSRSISELVDVVQGLAVYDVVMADFYGVEVPSHRYDEIHYRRFEHMLAGILALDSSPIDQRRSPQRRLLTRCAGFARLLTAMCRHHGIPARSRCGFATYLNAGRFEDHWVTEVWDGEQLRWRLVDAQIDAVWHERLQLHIDSADLSADEFLTAGDAWRRCRSGMLNPNDFGISFNRLHGL